MEKTASYEYLINEDIVKQFGKLTQENNLLHYDCEFARKTKFKKRIIPGMLTASYIATSVWRTFGNGTVFYTQKIKFVRPIYIGDTLIVELTVLGKTYINGLKLKIVCRVNEEMVVYGETEILLPE